MRLKRGGQGTLGDNGRTGEIRGANIAGIASRAAATANIVASRTRLGRRAADAKRALAAAAADGLQQHTRGAHAFGADRAGVIQANFAGITARAAAAANRVGLNAASVGANAAACREAASATAAANRLRKHAGSRSAKCADLAEVIDRDLRAIARSTASAAADVRFCAFFQRQSPASGKAASTTATADGLRKDRIAKVARGQDRADRAIGHFDRAALAARAARATNRIIGRCRLRCGKPQREAARTATATNRLRQHRDRAIAANLNVTIVDDLDRRSVTANPARTTQRVVNRLAIGRDRQ